MSDCIIWERAKNNGGYPVTWYQGKQVYVHRLIMNAKPGEIVLHTCDNPSCINPDHLELGTYDANSKDMVRKGRQAVGERCGNSKLKTHEVLLIRDSSLSSRILAKMFNISKTNVLDIKRRKIWRHL